MDRNSSWRRITGIGGGLLAAFIVIAAAALWFAHVSREAKKNSANNAPGDVAEVPREKAINGNPPAGPIPNRRSSAATAADSEPSSETREMISRLTKFVLNPQGITAGEAEEWKQILQNLVAQGPAALPAIREFLQKNEDVNFSGLRGGEMLGQASLRAGLINALAQIPGAEAQGLMVETLTNTALPLDVALLTQHLEQRAPGEFRQVALTAAADILGMADRGELSGWDVNSLFQLVQLYGGSSAASTLEQLGPRLKYYEAMTLASLPNGDGAATLARQAVENGFALQMLAQTAVQNREAANALIRQAQEGQIPEGGWSRIAMGLAGEQYGMIGIGSDGRPQLPDLPGVKTYRAEYGNQNFYSVPFSADATPQQVQERMNLLNQLRAATPDADARRLIDEARERLRSLMARK